MVLRCALDAAIECFNHALRLGPLEPRMIGVLTGPTSGPTSAAHSSFDSAKLTKSGIRTRDTEFASFSASDQRHGGLFVARLRLPRRPKPSRLETVSLTEHDAAVLLSKVRAAKEQRTA